MANEEYYQKFLEAQNTVCNACVLGGEKDCEVCPVRMTSEHLME